MSFGSKQTNSIKIVPKGRGIPQVDEYRLFTTLSDPKEGGFQVVNYVKNHDNPNVSIAFDIMV